MRVTPTRVALLGLAIVAAVATAAAWRGYQDRRDEDDDVEQAFACAIDLDTTGTTSADCSGAVAAAPETLTVRVAAAEIIGSGCGDPIRRSGAVLGEGARLTVTDDQGHTIGTGSFRDTGNCNFVADVELTNSVGGFYTLTAGVQLATVSRAELLDRGWRTRIEIGPTGAITIPDL